MTKQDKAEIISVVVGIIILPIGITLFIFLMSLWAKFIMVPLIMYVEKL